MAAPEIGYSLADGLLRQAQEMFVGMTTSRAIGINVIDANVHQPIL